MLQMLYVIVVAKRHLFSSSPGRSAVIVTTMGEAVFRARADYRNFTRGPKGGAWH